MRVLENCADGGRKLLAALAALMEASADFLFRIGLNFANGFLVIVAAVRANRAVGPVN